MVGIFGYISRTIHLRTKCSIGIVISNLLSNDWYPTWRNRLLWKSSHCSASAPTIHNISWQGTVIPFEFYVKIRLLIPYGISDRKRFLQTSLLTFAVLKEKVFRSLRLLLLDPRLSLLEENRMNPNMIRTTTTPPIMMISSFDRVLTKAESAFPRIPVRKEEKDC